jgi:hypothetical protein
MNDELVPIDSDLRSQLARRSAGRLPEGLLVDVTYALDAVPVSAAGLPRLRPVWRGPRLAAAGLGAALLAVLVVAIAFPALRGGPAAVPAGYPANRALTASELNSLLAGPPLATNTALVVSATIDIRMDVCPMNRYPTVGVIHGIEPQICVMQGGLPPLLTGTTTTGIFALRYLGARTFGLLGQVTPAPDSRIALGATDDWPLAGQTFLVNGWLGADDLPVSCVSPPAAGDVLSPAGEDCAYDDWLSDAPTAEGIAADHAAYAGSPQTSYDPLSLRGNARHVEAGGMRIIDGLDPHTPVHGVFVVRSQAEACSGALAVDSRGCPAWRVLARLADLSLTAPSAVATLPPGPTSTIEPVTTPAVHAPSPTPLALPTSSDGAAPLGLLGSGNRPLTEGEFASLWAADPAHLSGRIAIVKGPVPTGFECSDVGSVASGSPISAPGCHPLEGQIAPEGYWVVKIGADGKFTIVGELTVPSTGFVFTLDQVNAATTLKRGDLAVVDGWLLEHVPTCDYGPPLPSACGPFSEIASMATDNSPSGIGVQQGAYQQIIGVAGEWTIDGPPVHGLFLVQLTNTTVGTLVVRLEAVTP